MDLDWLLNWSFKSRQSFLLAHKLHCYPATFLPELAEKVISTFSKEDDVVLDIFSGVERQFLKQEDCNVKR